MAETVGCPWPLGCLQGRGSVLYSAPGAAKQIYSIHSRCLTVRDCILTWTLCAGCILTWTLCAGRAECGGVFMAKDSPI
jgi:hypothetical protein